MPGTYTFRVNEPYPVLVAKLLKGAKPPTVKVSIPEGTTLQQAAAIVSDDVKAIPAADYIEAARDDPPPFKLEGYKKGTTLEGMLFPATYEVLPEEGDRDDVRAGSARRVRRQLRQGRHDRRARRPTSPSTTSSSSPP